MAMQGSTTNISLTRNRPRRVAMPFRPWTEAQWLLRQHGISQRDIAEESGVVLSAVNRALSIRHFKKTNFASVAKVRKACEGLLWQYIPIFDATSLWNDYDAELYKEEG